MNRFALCVYMLTVILNCMVILFDLPPSSDRAARGAMTARILQE